jgi:hypothetical protein
MEMQDTVDRANSAIQAWVERANECLKAGRPADAKKSLTLAQRELRAIKAEIVAEEREVKASFTDARLQASKSGQTIGLFMNSKNQGRLAHARAAQKRTIAQDRQHTLDRYRKAKAALDDGIAHAERIKLDIDLGKYDTTDRESPTPTPATSIQPASSGQPDSVPAQWFPDPAGRFEFRYWDGEQWTANVSRQGVTSVDPQGV